MARVCQITGKHSMHGNKRSRAMNATARLFIPNIHYHRFWVNSENRFRSIRVSAKGIRLIDKFGIDYFLSNLSRKK